jgi:hypothetical protein
VAAHPALLGEQHQVLQRVRQAVLRPAAVVVVVVRTRQLLHEGVRLVRRPDVHLSSFQPRPLAQHRRRRAGPAVRPGGCTPAGRAEAEALCRLGLYPIVTFQYSSTTLYQDPYHMQSLFF